MRRVGTNAKIVTTGVLTPMSTTTNPSDEARL